MTNGKNRPNILLDSLTDYKVNKLLYNRFLNSRYPYNKDEIDYLRIYTFVNVFEIPFRIIDKTNLETELLTDALINLNIESEYKF